MRFFPFSLFEACRMLMMERDCRKELQFYTDLTELTAKLGSVTRSFVLKRTGEREAMMGKLGAKKKLSAVAATLPPPPLTAKPPLLPPLSFKPYTLDGVFDALKLGRESPQQTQQQWQNNGGVPSSPPPPSAPNRNLYTSVSSPAPGPSPYTRYPAHKPTLLPPTSSPPKSSFLPPPLPPLSSGILGGFVRTGGYTPIWPPAGQNIPPQPPSGQGALPPPLEKSVLPPRLPTMADLEHPRLPPGPKFPAAVLPIQSPPPPPQQPQQQQQQEALYQFNQFIRSASQGVQNRRNSDGSQVTRGSDETRVRRLQGNSRTAHTAANVSVAEEHLLVRRGYGRRLTIGTKSPLSAIKLSSVATAQLGSASA